MIGQREVWSPSHNNNNIRSTENKSADNCDSDDSDSSDSVMIIATVEKGVHRNVPLRNLQNDIVTPNNDTVEVECHQDVAPMPCDAIQLPTVEVSVAVCQCCAKLGPSTASFAGFELQRSHALRHLKYEDDVDLYRKRSEEIEADVCFRRRFEMCFPGELAKETAAKQAAVVLKQEPEEIVSGSNENEQMHAINSTTAEENAIPSTQLDKEMKAEEPADIPTSSTQSPSTVTLTGGDPKADWDWMRRCQPAMSPYLPQVGDQVWYFRIGHQLYLNEVELVGMYDMPKSLRPNGQKMKEEELCEVLNMQYITRPFRLIKVELAQLNSTTCRPTGYHFSVCFHDCDDVVDFLILKQHIDAAANFKWKAGDRFISYMDDKWMAGVVKMTKQKHSLSTDPCSRWMNMKIRWDDDSWNDTADSGTAISFWDIHPYDAQAVQSVAYGQDLCRRLGDYRSPESSEEWPHNISKEYMSRRLAAAIGLLTAQTSAGQTLWTLSYNSTDSKSAVAAKSRRNFFIVDLKLIWDRLQNLYYRRLAAVEFDLNYLVRSVERLRRGPNQERDANLIHRTITEFAKCSLETEERFVLEIYHRVDSETAQAADQKMDSAAAEAEIDDLLSQNADYPIRDEYQPGDGSESFIVEMSGEIATTAVANNTVQAMSVEAFEKTIATSTQIGAIRFPTVTIALGDDEQFEITVEWRTVVDQADPVLQEVLRVAVQEDGTLKCSSCARSYSNKEEFRAHIKELNCDILRNGKPGSSEMFEPFDYIKTEVYYDDSDYDDFYDEDFLDAEDNNRENKGRRAQKRKHTATPSQNKAKRPKRMLTRRPKWEICQECKKDVLVQDLTKHLYESHLPHDTVFCPIDICTYSEKYDYQKVMLHITEKHVEEFNADPLLTPNDVRTDDGCLDELRGLMGLCFPRLALCGGQINAPTHKGQLPTNEQMTDDADNGESVDVDLPFSNDQTSSSIIDDSGLIEVD